MLEILPSVPSKTPIDPASSTLESCFIIFILLFLEAMEIGKAEGNSKEPVSIQTKNGDRHENNDAQSLEERNERELLEHPDRMRRLVFKRLKLSL